MQHGGLRQDMQLLAESYTTVYQEAKGTKPGERLKQTKDREGPAGVTSSPIGKDYYNPEKLIPKVEPKDKGSMSAKETIRTLKYALELVGSFDDTRNAFAQELAKHIQLTNDLRVVLKRRQGLLERLQSLNTRLNRMYRTGASEEECEEVEVEIAAKEKKVEKAEIRAEELNTEIEKQLTDGNLKNMFSEIIKDAAGRLAEKLSPVQQKALQSATDLNDLSQLDVGMLQIEDPEQLFFLQKVLIEPETLDFFDRWFDMGMFRRQESEKTGGNYKFINPITHLSTLYKTAAIKSVFGDPSKRGNVASPHALRQAAKQSIGDALAEATTFLKSRDMQQAMRSVGEYKNDLLNDKQRKSFERAFGKLESMVKASGVDNIKKENILRKIDQFKQDNITERDLISTIYNINEESADGGGFDDLVQRALLFS